MYGGLERGNSLQRLVINRCRAKPTIMLLRRRRRPIEVLTFTTIGTGMGLGSPYASPPTARVGVLQSAGVMVGGVGWVEERGGSGWIGVSPEPRCSVLTASNQERGNPPFATPTAQVISVYPPSSIPPIRPNHVASARYIGCVQWERRRRWVSSLRAMIIASIFGPCISLKMLP